MNPAFVVAMVLGALMLVSVCFVYVKHQTFGLGGTCLSGFGVILLGMSVWKTVDVSFDEKGVRAKLEQVESVAKRADTVAEQAHSEVRRTTQALNGLQSTVEITILQEKLKAAGLYKSPADGYLGPATKAALMRAQEAKGLPPTGKLDEATKQALDIKTPAAIQIQ